MNIEPRRVLILAGGLSSRFGSDKLLYRVEGKEIIKRVVEAARLLAEDVVLSVRNEETGEKLSKLTGASFEVEEDFPCSGPVRGLLTSFRGGDTLLLPADLPWIDSSALASFIDLCGELGTHQVCGLLWSAQGRNLDTLISLIRSDEPLSYVKRACFLKKTRISDVHRASSELLMVSAGLIPDPWRFLDLDTPGDLERRGGRWEREAIHLSLKALDSPYRAALEGLEMGSYQLAREKFNLELGLFMSLGIENISSHIRKDLENVGGFHGGR